MHKVSNVILPSRGSGICLLPSACWTKGAEAKQKGGYLCLKTEVVSQSWIQMLVLAVCPTQAVDFCDTDIKDAFMQKEEAEMMNSNGKHSSSLKHFNSQAATNVSQSKSWWFDAFAFEQRFSWNQTPSLYPVGIFFYGNSHWMYSHYVITSPCNSFHCYWVRQSHAGFKFSSYVRFTVLYQSCIKLLPMQTTAAAR